ncbi:MAG: copper resistance protein CopC [Frankia sp.]|nr:copper resistance protein CopC [Frankia sp.]
MNDTRTERADLARPTVPDWWRVVRFVRAVGQEPSAGAARDAADESAAETTDVAAVAVIAAAGTEAGRLRRLAGAGKADQARGATPTVHPRGGGPSRPAHAVRRGANAVVAATDPGRRAGRRAGVLVAALVFALAGIVVAAAGPASAHSQLVSSSPAAGEQLAASPSAVELRFSQDLLTVGTVVIVADTAGATWTSGDPTVAGAVLTAPLKEDLPSGSYQIRWRVVSADGHPVSGAIPFTVGTPAPGQAAMPSATTWAGVGPAPATTSTATAGSGASSDSDDTQAAGDDGGGSSSGGPLRLLVVGGLGALVALALLGLVETVRHRARRRIHDTGSATAATEQPAGTGQAGHTSGPI